MTIRLTSNDVSARSECEECVRLRAINTELLAYAECQEAWDRYRLGGLSGAEVYERLRGHGWQRMQPVEDFLKDLRYAALSKATGQPATVPHAEDDHDE